MPLIVLRIFIALLIAAAAPMTQVLAEEKGALRYGTIPAGAYAVVAEVRAKPGQEKALREATLPLVAKVRGEPNNLVYFLHEDRVTPGRFVFYEIFASKADFEAHNATPHVQAWFGRLPELAEDGVKVMQLEILGNLPAEAR